MSFATTRWSLVVTAGGGSSPEARAALETLCASYWYPLYAFARRKGRDAEAAKDSVQAFFARLLENEALAAADPGRGRFRTYLLTCFSNHMRNEAEHAAALKRGGGRAPLSFDADPERRFRIEPAHEATPERLFERDWALAVLERVLARLRADYAERGKQELFDGLEGTLAGGGGIPHAERAEALGMTEGALKVAVHRLRGRYRDALRAEVAETLAEGENVDDEIAALFRALAPV